MNGLRRHKETKPPGELRDVFTAPPGAISRRDTPVSPEERRRLLAARVQQNIVNGGSRVESHSDYEAVLVRGHRPNHVLHLLLTIVTFGAWALIWILLAATNRERRALLAVDEYGRVDLQPLKH